MNLCMSGVQPAWPPLGQVWAWPVGRRRQPEVGWLARPDWLIRARLAGGRDHG